jgi:hypothetical protein
VKPNSISLNDEEQHQSSLLVKAATTNMEFARQMGLLLERSRYNHDPASLSPSLPRNSGVQIGCCVKESSLSLVRSRLHRDKEVTLMSLPHRQSGSQWRPTTVKESWSSPRLQSGS